MIIENLTEWKQGISIENLKKEITRLENLGVNWIDIESYYDENHGTPTTEINAEKL